MRTDDKRHTASHRTDLAPEPESPLTSEDEVLPSAIISWCMSSWIFFSYSCCCCIRRRSSSKADRCRAFSSSWITRSISSVFTCTGQSIAWMFLMFLCVFKLLLLCVLPLQSLLLLLCKGKQSLWHSSEYLKHTHVSMHAHRHIHTHIHTHTHTHTDTHTEWQTVMPKETEFSEKCSTRLHLTAAQLQLSFRLPQVDDFLKVARQHGAGFCRCQGAQSVQQVVLTLCTDTHTYKYSEIYTLHTQQCLHRHALTPPPLHTHTPN